MITARRHVPKGYKPGQTYPLGDTPTAQETNGASFNERVVMSSVGGGTRAFQAEPTGEKRPPRKGEWYLSGAIVAAYRAANDLSTEYLIARLVDVRERARQQSALADAAPDLLLELQRMQWSRIRDHEAHCPVCGAKQANGHTPACSLGAAITKATGEKL